ncbi:MAG TPA: HEAT repeat domain-containing protein [Planctomycetaceae bacterium]|nr:HEAT repeat domain-containing protein [Planctomycetaceae bacterium]
MPFQQLTRSVAILPAAALVVAAGLAGGPVGRAACAAEPEQAGAAPPQGRDAGGAPGADETSQAAPTSPYDGLLRERGVVPTAEGVIAYLRSLHPSETEYDEHLRLIEQLGNADFAEREAASKSLAALSAPPVAALTAAAASDDPEVRWRARKILALSDRSAVLFAVLRAMELQAVEGAVPEILSAVPLCERPHLKAAARDALRAVARPADADVLRRALGDAHVEVRAAAALALGTVLGRAAAVELALLLDEPRQAEPVRLAAARALADLGDRRALPVLIDLLSSEDLSIRLAAGLTLRGLTGEHFQFVAYDSPDVRAAAIEHWRVWLRTRGETAPLRFPVAVAEWGESFLGGHTLLAYGYQNKVVELGLDRRPVWSYEVRGGFSAEKLSNGNVLIAAYGPNKVLEVDPQGHVVWEHAVASCLNARLLPNGNVLVAGHTSKKAFELTRDKQVVWQHESPHNCYDAHRLPDGNTLLAVGQQVEEISPEGAVVWSYRANGSVYGVQPLASGNILLTDTSRGALELTRDRRIVWQFTEGNAFDAFRMPNGNTLIASNRRFIEVTPEGTIAWELSGGGYGRARR